jgi:hypothetical protein
MKAKIENSVSMLMATDQILTDYETCWTGTVKFAAAVSDFRVKLASITDERQVMEKQIKAITAYKLEKKKTLTQCTLVVADIAYAYAVNTGDLPLQGLVDYSYSKLMYVRDTVTRDRCLLVYNTVLPLASQLMDLGLAATMMPELNTAIQDYQIALSQPRLAIGSRKVAGKTVSLLVREASEILEKQIGKMMTRFKILKPEFYNKFQSARMIIDYGHRSTKPISTIRGLTIDFETGQVLANVHVWLQDGSSETFSDSTGKYELPVFKTGTICIMAEKPEYKLSEEDWDVMNDSDYEINIDLEAKEPETPPEEPL